MANPMVTLELNGDNIMAPRDIFMDIVMYLEGMVVKFINYDMLHIKLP